MINRLAGIKCGGLAKFGNRRVDLALRCESIAKVIVGGGKLGIERNGLVKFGDGFVPLPLTL